MLARCRVALTAGADAHDEIALAGGHMLELPALLHPGVVVLEPLGDLATKDSDGAVVLEDGRRRTGPVREHARTAGDERCLERQGRTTAVGEGRVGRGRRPVRTARRDLQRGAGHLRLERRTGRREGAVLGAERERGAPHHRLKIERRSDACTERNGSRRRRRALGQWAVAPRVAGAGSREHETYRKRHPRARVAQRSRHRKRVHPAHGVQKSNLAPTPGFTRKSVVPSSG